MATVGSAATAGEKELKRKYPYESGLTAGTTKQEGRISNIIPKNSRVPRNQKKGIYSGF